MIIGFFNFNILNADNSTELSNQEAQEILLKIQDAVNKWDSNSIIVLLSEKSWTWISEKIVNNIEWKNIQYLQEISKIENLWNWQFKIHWRYQAKWLNWEATWLSNYYIVEKDSNEWKIIDTNFYQFMPEFMNFFGPIFPILMLLLFIFFIWMLIDCSKRNIDNKWMWYLLIIFVPFGSVIYFFTARKKYPRYDKYLKKEEKNLQI